MKKVKTINSKYLDKLLKEINSNEDSFNNLYKLIKAPIYGYSLSLLKNHQDALDNMQDVFIKICEAKDKYTSLNKPMSWIFTITKNEALMKLRKKKRVSPEELNENLLISPTLGPEDKLIIKTLMEKLSDEERKIIIMHLVGNLKHKEIASLLNLKLSTTLSKYHRALAKLRTMEEK